MRRTIFALTVVTGSAGPAAAGKLADLRRRLLGRWDPEWVERQVHLARQRRKIARCKNVCKDLRW